jgi:hypothetical protein
MSEKKKYSAEYAARMVLKKAYDMFKARVDEGHHEGTKRSIRAKRHEDNAKTPRISPIQGIAALSGQKDRAKHEAKQNLKTIQSMPKPNLPKSEQQSSDMKKMKKCGDMQTMKKSKKLNSFMEKIKSKQKKEEKNG